MKVHPFKQISQDQKTIHCTACGNEAPVESCKNGPDNGLHLTGFAGYYGGFTDRNFDLSADAPSAIKEFQQEFQTYQNAWFCHACCVKLFEVFPHLAKAVGIKGKYSHESRHHPCPDETPCCRYAWTVAKDPHHPGQAVDLYAYYNKGTKQLEWRPLEPF